MLDWKTNYRVKDFANYWSIIDTYKGYALLENNKFGDESFYVVAKMDAPVERMKAIKKDGEIVDVDVIMDVVDTTWDCLEDFVEQDLPDIEG